MSGVKDESPISTAPSIGLLAEKSLHAALKTWYAQPGDEIEVPLKGEASDGRRFCYHIDIVRRVGDERTSHASSLQTADLPLSMFGEGVGGWGTLLIEIQTRSFSSLKRKLYTLTEPHHTHHVRLVYPIPAERWLVDLDAEGNTVKRRKSPKRGRVEDAFSELVRLPDLICRPNFSFEVLLIRDEEHRIDDGKGSWRRKRRSIHDRRLLEVVESRVFETPSDFYALLPPGLYPPFTVRDVAKIGKLSPSLAGKMVYCLWKMGALARVGHRRRSILYAPPSSPSDE